MQQAPGTANDYLSAAVRSIDNIFDEEGYAKKHPELVGKMIEVAARDFHTACLSIGFQKIRESIESLNLK